MAFEPITMDGQAAAARLLAKRTNKPLACLFEVFQIFPFERSDAPGAYTSARVSWNRTPKARRHSDRDVPAGAIVYFKLHIDGGETDDPWPGHICISRGGNRIVTTDFPTRGKISETTIDELERAWASNDVEYLGWTDWLGGHNVTVGPRPSEGSAAGGQTGAVYRVVRSTILRSKPAQGSAVVIMRLKPGKRLRVIGFSGSYAVVRRVNGDTAYVWAARLMRETLTTTQATPLRAKASPRGRRITTLAAGRKVRVIGAATVGRVQVKVGSLTGWAYRKHLR